MRILIVGCGYLGLRAAQLWDEQGAEIVAVTRSPARAAEWSSRGWEPVVGDITQPETLAEIKPVDFCLYAVGYDRHAEHSKREVYIDGLRFSLQQLRHKTPRLLYISSASVYGQDDGSWVDETSPCEPRTESGQICLEAEHLVEAAASPELGVMVLRLSGIYGPQRLLTRLEQLQTGAPLGGQPEAWLNLIHVDDAAAAAVQLARDWNVYGPAGPFRRYLLSDKLPVQRSTFYGNLASLVGAPAPQFDPQLPTRSGTTVSGKRCNSQKIRRDFAISYRFPTIQSGLPDAVHRTTT